jgi:hypothetical protein
VTNPSAILPSEITALFPPGEAIVWQEQPRPYVFILRGLHYIAYAMTWGVLGAFWYYGATLAQFEGWWKIIPYLSWPFILTGFRFFLVPIQLGERARHTWYIVTNRRVLIAELSKKKLPTLRVFTPDEMAPPQMMKRIDGLYNVILTRRAQDHPHLQPQLDSGFFGLVDGETAIRAVNSVVKS